MKVNKDVVDTTEIFAGVVLVLASAGGAIYGLYLLLETPGVWIGCGVLSLAVLWLMIYSDVTRDNKRHFDA